MLWKCYTQYVSKFRKLSSGHRTGKGQFSFQCQRRAMPKTVASTIQLCSFHMLARLCSKSFKLGLSNVWTKNFQMCKLGFKVAEESEIKLPTFLGSLRKQGSSRKTSTSVSLTVISLWLCGSQQTGEFLKTWEYQTTLSVLWETYMWVKKEQLELDMKQLTGLKWERSTTRLYIVTLFI